MELLQLRYFFESAKIQSFKRTAEKYMVPAPSVSASVKRLENELGCKLFDRTSNRIKLNNNGKKLYDSLCTVFDELDRTCKELIAENADKCKINILTQTIMNAQKVRDSITEYHKEHPHVTFKTNYMLPETNLEDYDIIIDKTDDIYEDYEHFELSCHRIHLGVAANNPLCGKKLTMKDLKDQPFIIYRENGRTHTMLKRVCEKAGFEPNIVLQTNNTATAQKCVEAGFGILPSRHKSQSPMIDFLDVSDFNETETLCCHYKKEINHGNVAKFLDILRSKADMN